MLVPCVLSCARVLLKIGKLHRQQTLHTLFFKLSIVKNYLCQSREFFSLGIMYPIILKIRSKTSYSCYSLFCKAGHNRQLFDNSTMFLSTDIVVHRLSVYCTSGEVLAIAYTLARQVDTMAKKSSFEWVIFKKLGFSDIFDPFLNVKVCGSMRPKCFAVLCII